MLLMSVVALTSAHLLPGLLVVKVAGVGRSSEERLLLAAVVGGPLAAGVYLASLLTGSSEIYWGLTAALAAAGLLSPWRKPAPDVWPRRSKLVLLAVLAGLLVSYLATTGRWYRLDPSGDLLLDQALQRDALFHVGVIRSLEHAYPPALLSVSALPIGYHVGYHLQLAALARHFGVDPFDGLIRVGAIWEIALLLFSAYLLARRFTRNERARLLAAVLVFGSGLGFLALSRPSVDWWSLAFMDVSLVSIFLANPFLPSLPLLFSGLALLGDDFEHGEWGARALAAVLLAFAFVVKMFAGAQVVAALFVAVLVRPRERRPRHAFAALAALSLPLVFRTALSASSSNTAITLRPFEIVRYSMEKLDWERAVSALAAIGRFESPREGFVFVVLVAFVWLVGFCGLRLFGLRGVTADLFGEDALRRTMAWLVAIGLPLALFFRVAPAAAEGLSRVEAQNDVVWFAALSGVLLWFWTALAVARLRWVTAVLVVVLVALPATVQHFVHEAGLEPDRISDSRVEAAREARRISAPSAIWIDAPDRARPSLLPYLSGRPVVYDSYVGYDYMFVGRDELEARRHAVAQFWSTTDPAFAAWVLARFDVAYLWEEDRAVPDAARLYLENLFDNGDVALHRVERADVVAGIGLRIAPAGEIPLGGRGHPYFGRGWDWVEGESFRVLTPGASLLYLPRERGRSLTLTLELAAPHAPGEIDVGSARVAFGAEEVRVELDLGPAPERGLAPVAIAWRGAEPLHVTRVAARLSSHDGIPR